MDKKQLSRFVLLITITQSALAGPNEDFSAAVKSDDLNKAETALSRNADINKKNMLGMSPLMIAVQRGNAKMVEFLLQRNPDIDAADQSKKTVLDYKLTPEIEKLIEKYRQTQLVKQQPSLERLIGASEIKSNVQEVSGEAVPEENFVVQESPAVIKEREEAQMEKNRDFLRAVRAKSDNLQKLQQALEDGADINARDHSGKTCLMIAASKGQKDIVEFLLEEGADINNGDNKGNTVLNDYSITQEIRRFIELYKRDGKKPLVIDQVASFEKDTSIVQDESRAARVEGNSVTVEPEVSSQEKQKVLLLQSKNLLEALVDSDFEKAKAALEAGANPNAKDSFGMTSLAVALDLDPRSADIFNENKIAIAELLVKKGADVNVRNSYGSSPLVGVLISSPLDSKALRQGKLIIARILVEAGADLSGKYDMDRCTALMIAARYQDESFVSFLIDKGADVNAMTKMLNMTPLIEAASEGIPGVVKLLLDRGANVNQGNSDGDTALINASQLGRAHIVAILVDNGAQINGQNLDGNTALIGAARAGKLKVAELLAERNANINHQNSNGNTALMEAVLEGRTEIVKFLVSRRADINYENRDLDTALIIAAQYQDHDLVRFLVDSGADINQTNRKSDTALKVAIKAGRKRVVDFLSSLQGEALPDGARGKAMPRK